MVANSIAAEASKGTEPSAPSMEQAPEPSDYNVQYIMSVNLQEDMGSDIPLNDRRLSYSLDDSRGKVTPSKGDIFEQEREDYWLFSVHVNEGEMDFLIGGENPAYATCAPNWRNISDERKQGVILHGDRSGVYRTGEFRFERERFVAVRAPKATNPAITVWGRGNYTALNWVGLFIQSSAPDTNEFIAVRTSSKILPKYADRTLEKMRGTDVTGRSITLFPKQLFGTDGVNRATFGKFVTGDPHNKLGHAHWIQSKAGPNGILNKCPAYTWNANGKTVIEEIIREDVKGDNPVRLPMFDYSKGCMLLPRELSGKKILILTFGSLLEAVLGLVRGDIASVIKSITDFTDKAISGADLNGEGMVTALVKIGQAVWEKKKKKINTDGVDDLVTKLSSLIDTDFGSC
ncbi:hypothetical protein N7481_001543 [Penicillium waksmanii]|uniref:uncharacterized protein n=1 Tax=Penicillium waksmanii TaxID=69791 RepID=UPI002547A591|nr:uncharacterized protein N7481_001543 [Penicillium waksmanii]KAJ6001134.1 hypothetical protein N7481_001543 [Penicillium waksmanii]